MEFREYRYNTVEFPDGLALQLLLDCKITSAEVTSENDQLKLQIGGSQEVCSQ